MCIVELEIPSLIFLRKVSKFLNYKIIFIFFYVLFVSESKGSFRVVKYLLRNISLVKECFDRYGH